MDSVLSKLHKPFQSFPFLYRSAIEKHLQGDVLTIAETKLDETFPNSQFIIEGFKRPFRLALTKNGGGQLLYIKEGLPVKQLLNYNFPPGIEVIAVESNLKKQKWLLLCMYRPPSQRQKCFFGEIEKCLDSFSNKFENLLLMGDLNCEISESEKNNFVDSYNFTSIVKEPTCFKSAKPRCIDLILTNRKSNLKSTTTFETGLADFHTMILTVLKGGYIKKSPRIVQYRNYTKFRTINFTHDIANTINDLSGMVTFDCINTNLTKILYQHAPIKKKYIRANDGPFMTKELRKVIMHRSKLKNKYNKNKTNKIWNAFKHQRNNCVAILRKSKLIYYRYLDTKNLADNRKFWKTVKPVLTDKVQVSPLINLMQKFSMNILQILSMS